jgi:hypothetical protein
MNRNKDLAAYLFLLQVICMNEMDRIVIFEGKKKRRGC